MVLLPDVHKVHAKRRIDLVQNIGLLMSEACIGMSDLPGVGISSLTNRFFAKTAQWRCREFCVPFLIASFEGCQCHSLLHADLQIPKDRRNITLSVWEVSRIWKQSYLQIGGWGRQTERAKIV